MNFIPRIDFLSHLATFVLQKCIQKLILGISGHNLQLVGDLRGQMLVLQDWPGIDASLRWAGPSMKVQDFWSPGVVGCTGFGKGGNGRVPGNHMETRCMK